MTTFEQFYSNSKMRHDFADMIQVRFHHESGEEFDTWVSGEEVLQRLRSDRSEKRLEGLSRLDREQLERARDQLPDQGKEKLRASLTDWVGEQIESAIGGNIIGDHLADAVRGQQNTADEDLDRHRQWQALLLQEDFRKKVLELAWIQLEGSFPETQSPGEPDDWL